MKKFKRIYIEITNICNLNCSFCSTDNRVKKQLSSSDFEEVLKKIDDYTDYIYLHVKGEPLLHNNLKEILDLAYKYNKYVNITTNGTLLLENKELLKHPSVRLISISLHSENKKDNYIEDIIKTVEDLKNKIVIYRFWTLNNGKMNTLCTENVNKIISYYNLSPEIVEKGNNIKIKDNLYIDKDEEFIWPSLDNDYYNEHGMCYALKSQLAILVDGTVVPCCLDSNGVIKLGNIFTDTLENIINSEKYKNIRENFKNSKAHEELCKHCSFKNMLIKNK